MKRIVYYCLLVLLALGGSCKKPLEVVEVGEPPLPPEGCRIVKTYYKHPSIGAINTGNKPVAAETIKLDDGTQVEVSLTSTSTYIYDNQNRIIEEKSISPYDFYYVSYYKYGLELLIRNDEYHSPTIGPKPIMKSDTIQLNDKGLFTFVNGSGLPVSIYNDERQLITHDPDRPNSLTYENSNVVESLHNHQWIQENGKWVPIDYQLRRYTYNLNRPNLPTILQFAGNGSRNLPIKEVWEMKRSSAFPDGPVYQKTFTYVYDKQGRVKRRITHGTALYRGWLIEDNLYGVGVYDYEYECN